MRVGNRPPVHVLLLEHDTAESRRIRELLEASAAAEIHVRSASELSQGLALLGSGGADVILLDLGLPGRDPLENFVTLYSKVDEIPIVVLSGLFDRADAFKALRRGAHDVILKEGLEERLLVHAVQVAVERAKGVSALRRSEAEYRSLFEHALEALYRSTPDGRLVAVNKAFVRLLGYDSEEDLLRLGPQALFVNPEDRRSWVRDVLSSGEVRNTETLLRRKDGGQIAVLESTRAVRSVEGELLYFQGALVDVTERKESEKRLLYLATHDTLTGLFNRHHFAEELDRELSRSRRYDLHGAVLWIDVDGFKGVNDTLGHLAGDELLVSIAGLLKDRMRSTDTLGRLGGDEFAVLLPYAGRDEATAVAHAILSRMSSMVEAQLPSSVPASLSIGIALYDKGRPDSDTLLRRADLAMYEAKEGGGDRVGILDHDEPDGAKPQARSEPPVRAGLVAAPSDRTS